jgi:hypothetical protein
MTYLVANPLGFFATLNLPDQGYVMTVLQFNDETKPFEIQPIIRSGKRLNIQWQNGTYFSQPVIWQVIIQS